MHAKSFLLTGASLLLFAVKSHGQWAVIDAAQIAQNETNQAMNYVNYVNTQLNTYQQVQQQITQLERLGNPATYTNLAGLSQLGTMTQKIPSSFQGLPQMTGNTTSLTSGSVLQLGNATPTQIFANLQGTYQPINPTATTAAGTAYSLTPGQYVYQGAVNNSAANYAARMAQIGQQQAALTASINTTLQNLDGAQTDAEVQKYSALLAAQNAQLAALGQQAAQVAAQAAQQQTSATASQQAQQQAQSEQNAAEARDGETKAAAFFSSPSATSSLQQPSQ